MLPLLADDAYLPLRVHVDSDSCPFEPEVYYASHIRCLGSPGSCSRPNNWNQCAVELRPLIMQDDTQTYSIQVENTLHVTGMAPGMASCPRTGRWEYFLFELMRGCKWDLRTVNGEVS